MPEGELALTENTKLVYSASCDLDGQIFLAVPATSTDAGLSLSVDCAFVSNEQVDSIYLNGIDFSGSCSSTVANDCQNPIEFKQPPIAGAVLAFELTSIDTSFVQVEMKCSNGFRTSAWSSTWKCFAEQEQHLGTKNPIANWFHSDSPEAGWNTPVTFNGADICNNAAMPCSSFGLPADIVSFDIFKGTEVYFRGYPYGKASPYSVAMADAPVEDDEGVCQPPSTNSQDAGYSDSYRGWYSVSGDGCCNDYCRWVGNSGAGGDPAASVMTGTGPNDSFWSCRLDGGYPSFYNGQIWAPSTKNSNYATVPSTCAVPECSATEASNVCSDNPEHMCFFDDACNDCHADNFNCLGCNAGGKGMACRYCGFGAYSDIVCPGVCTPTTIGASAIVEGSSAVLDGWSNFNEVFTSWGVPAGKVTEWTFEARRTNGVALQVWRLSSGNTYTLVGQNIFPITTVGVTTYSVPDNMQIVTQEGDMLCIRHHDQSVIPYTGGSTMKWGPNNGHQSTANNIGDSITFTGSGGRDYQVQAVICAE